MGGRDGGTQMWCDECKAVRVCRAVSTGDGQRYYSTRYSDIRWFERLRECLTCSNQWVTYEVDRTLIYELMTLRDGIKDVTSTVRASLRNVSKADYLLRRIEEDIDQDKSGV